MYKQVANQTPTLELYINKLAQEGTFNAAEIEEQRKWVWDRLSENFEASKTYVSERKNFPPGWDSLPSPAELAVEKYPVTQTAAEHDTLKSIADKVSSVPEGFELHQSLQRILAGRLNSFGQGSVDWSTAEALAFGTLCLEGHPIRLTGQDVQRGTFSQRHSVLHNQATGETWTPLNTLSHEQAPYEAINSPLSEFGALGFEYGVTLADPNPLVMWEAQFGDFANNAQVMLDNFIVAGESKWLDRSGIVLSLPHGYDGQGAEHSSARLERFLLMCNEEGRSWPSEEAIDRAHQDSNMGIVCMTSPANYFHVLRRQLKREYRKHSEDKISRVTFCSGQVYASLVKHRATNGVRDTAITRIKELHPLPWREVKANLEKYPNAQNIVWAQEKHYNGGAWHYVRDRLEAVLRESDSPSARKLLYAGRAVSASPATGLKKKHEVEEKQLLEDAFSVQE
ncbi:hypothetical protein N0V84_001230 [Fusarium piperis]|uniref:Transketolase-like pyrimidine-binding domain-containing protein n=1 Tax=Fusarium piperis TaxID=1435070 RepID=A0A9W8WLJ5_9HYPO|nr:hypothetical protein N0V84_001230 [Fusarium piperis]